MTKEEYDIQVEDIRQFLELTEPLKIIVIDEITKAVDPYAFLDGHWSMITNENVSMRTRIPYLMRMQKAIKTYSNWV